MNEKTYQYDVALEWPFPTNLVSEHLSYILANTGALRVTYCASFVISYQLLMLFTSVLVNDDSGRLGTLTSVFSVEILRKNNLPAPCISEFSLALIQNLYTAQSRHETVFFYGLGHHPDTEPLNANLAHHMGIAGSWWGNRWEGDH